MSSSPAFQVRRVFITDTNNISAILFPSLMTYLPISRQSASLIVYSSRPCIFILTTMKPIVLALPYEQRLRYLLAGTFIIWEAPITIKATSEIRDSLLAKTFQQMKTQRHTPTFVIVFIKQSSLYLICNT